MSRYNSNAIGSAFELNSNKIKTNKIEFQIEKAAALHRKMNLYLFYFESNVLFSEITDDMEEFNKISLLTTRLRNEHETNY